jgi:hypothetical protein
MTQDIEDLLQLLRDKLGLALGRNLERVILSLISQIFI